MLHEVYFPIRLFFRFLTTFFGIFLLAQCSTQGYGQALESGTIDFRQPANLKMVFDGGLRPYRLQGLENSCCVFDKATLTVILPNSSPFTLSVSSGNINVLAENEISSLDLFGLYTSVPEAVNLTKTICRAWRVSTTGLDQAAANLGTIPDFTKGWGQEVDLPAIRAQVIFRPIYYFDHVGGFVNVAFTCGDHFNGVKFLTKPIQPPPGYENISMDPPSFKPGVPTMSFEEARAKVQTKLAEILSQKASPSPNPTPAALSKVPRVGLLVLVGLAVVIGVWVLSRRKK
jgi:hypothetical protein